MDLASLAYAAGQEHAPCNFPSKGIGTLDDAFNARCAFSALHKDIGTVKLPRWIAQHTGKKLQFSFTSGGSFPENLLDYALVVHCGGCTLNQREMQRRVRAAVQQGVPMTNYGILIAYMQGILRRCVQPFAEVAELLES